MPPSEVSSLGVSLAVLFREPVKAHVLAGASPVTASRGMAAFQKTAKDLGFRPNVSDRYAHLAITLYRYINIPVR